MRLPDQAGELDEGLLEFVLKTACRKACLVMLHGIDDPMLCLRWIVCHEKTQTTRKTFANFVSFCGHQILFVLSRPLKLARGRLPLTRMSQPA